jgi:hypothetical protein
MGGRSFGIDLVTERLCARGFLQKEHAEARKELFPRAGEAVQHVLDSQESLKDALEVFNSFPRRQNLKTLSQNIAKAVLAKEAKERTYRFSANTVVQEAVKKLDVSEILEEEWEQIEKGVKELLTEEEDLEDTFYDHYIARKENLWWLNATQNAQKGDRPFLKWITDTIIAPEKHPSNQAEQLSEHMLHYLHFWYERSRQAAGEKVLSFQVFAEEFKKQYREEQDPFGIGGLFDGTIQGPEPERGQPFHKICVGEERFAFGESLTIWYLREHAPDVRISQLLTIINLRAEFISTEALKFLRSEEDVNPEERKLIQEGMIQYIGDLNRSSKRAIRQFTGRIGKINEKLAGILDEVQKRQGIAVFPTGDVATFQLVSSSEEESSQDEERT